MFRKRFFIGLAVFLCLEAFSYADEVHYYQENGVTYRETRRYVTRPVVETKTQQTTRTVYKEEAYTENRDVAKTTWVPVTSYVPQTYWVGYYNPFMEPYLETEMVPQVCWQQHTEMAKMPVVCRKYTPETQTVNVPICSQRMVTETQVTRTPITTAMNVGAARTNAVSMPNAGTMPNPGTTQWTSATNRTAPSLFPGTTPTPSPSLYTAQSTNDVAWGATSPYSANNANGIRTSTNPSSSQPIGGVSSLYQDPPRYGTSTEWRSSY